MAHRISEGTTTTADGRTLAWCEVGDPHGPLLLHNHGVPGSRLEVRMQAEAAAANGVRMVGVDRPGIGRSDPLPGYTFAGWSDDLVTVADALGAERFGVSGASAGSAWALAAATHIDPVRLRHVSSIAGTNFGAFGANWAASYMDQVDRLGGWVAMNAPTGIRLMYRAIGIQAVHFDRLLTAQMMAGAPPADRETLAMPGVRERFRASSRESFRQGADAPARDAITVYEAWPFDVATITRPVHIWQGMEDRLVSPEVNQILAERIPGAVWHPFPDEGHFVFVSQAPEILALAAAELAD
jgi:pimeloyl-ACP methyl ester carboxylesterase